MYVCTCQGFIWDLTLVGRGGMVHMEPLSVMPHGINSDLQFNGLYEEMF